MKVSTISLHQQEQCDRDLCACIGYFDGLHRGHQALLDKTIELAEQYGCESALITFSPDPWITTGKAQKVRHLTTMTQRSALAEKRGIESSFWILPPRWRLCRRRNSLKCCFGAAG